MNKRIIDLSMTIHEGMQTFPAHWHPFVEITQLGRHGIENRETRKITLGTHTGTHIDCPRHFIPGGLTVDHLSLEQINGPAILLDLTATPAKTAVGVEEIKVAAKGRSVERVLLRFDWSQHLGTMEYYNDQPYLTEEACQWLVDNGCRLIGMDVAMPDNPKNGRGCTLDSPNHKIFLMADTIILEYLVNMAALGDSEFDVTVAPLKILDGDGAPVRCFATLK